MIEGLMMAFQPEVMLWMTVGIMMGMVVGTLVGSEVVGKSVGDPVGATVVGLLVGLMVGQPGATVRSLGCPAAKRGCSGIERITGADHAAFNAVRRVIPLGPLGSSAGGSSEPLGCCEALASSCRRSSLSSSRSSFLVFLPSLMAVPHPSARDASPSARSTV